MKQTYGRRQKASGDPVTIRQVAQARGMQRKRYTLGQIAGILGVRSDDLDRAL